MTINLTSPEIVKLERRNVRTVSCTRHDKLHNVCCSHGTVAMYVNGHLQNTSATSNVQVLIKDVCRRILVPPLQIFDYLR